MQLVCSHLPSMQQSLAASSSCGHKTSHCPRHQILHQSPAARHDARQWPMLLNRAVAVSFDKETGHLRSNGRHQNSALHANKLEIELNICRYHDNALLSRPIPLHRRRPQTAQPVTQHGLSDLSTAAPCRFPHHNDQDIPYLLHLLRIDRDRSRNLQARAVVKHEQDALFDILA